MISAILNVDGTINWQEIANILYDNKGELATIVNAVTQKGATSARPTTNLSAGVMYFDTTLDKPIWRNAANTGWVDATGQAVE